MNSCLYAEKPLSPVPGKTTAEKPLHPEILVPPLSPSNQLEHALEYLRLGWSVIPVAPRDKKPLITWKEFQQRYAEPDEVRAWFRRWPDANLGIVTGRISGLVVIDIDGDEGMESLSGLGLCPTLSVSTGRGLHAYYAYPGREVANRVGLLAKVDVRGDGGYVAAPPSIHPSGVQYAWANGLSPEAVALKPLPDCLAELLAAGRPVSPQVVKPPAFGAGADAVAEGCRNATLFSIAYHLACRRVQAQLIPPLVSAYNSRFCVPPLHGAEVETIINSAASRWLERIGG